MGGCGWRRVFGLVLLFLVAIPCAHAEDDLQLWQESSVRLYARGSYQMSAYQTLRFRDDMNELYFIQSKIIHSYRWRPWLKTAINYSYIQMKDSGNHWAEEHRPELELTPILHFGEVTLSHRFRAEMRMIEGGAGEEDWRFRNRFEVSRWVPKTDKKLRVFANEEIFYSTPPSAWNQNRVFVGLSYQACALAKATLAWGIQSIRTGSDWDDRQVLLGGLAVVF